ncbi:MAG: hypothetical protein ACO3K7_00890 [Candidatus Marinamargulisbacteria bacterium]
MEKVRGVIFLLESLFKNAKTQLFSKHLLVHPDDIFPLIEKLMAAVSDIEKTMADQTVDRETPNEPATELVDTQKEVVRLKKEANTYADDILSRLQLAVTKLQQNTIKMEKNITEGRKLIQKKQLNYLKGESNET